MAAIGLVPAMTADGDDGIAPKASAGRTPSGDAGAHVPGVDSKLAGNCNAQGASVDSKLAGGPGAQAGSSSGTPSGRTRGAGSSGTQQMDLPDGGHLAYQQTTAAAHMRHAPAVLFCNGLKSDMTG